MYNGSRRDKSNTKTEGKVIFYGIYFDTLKKIVKFLKENMATNVYIVDHTNNAGDFNHNMTLSKDLVSKYGISKKQVTAGGVGRYPLWLPMKPKTEWP